MMCAHIDCRLHLFTDVSSKSTSKSSILVGFGVFMKVNVFLSMWTVYSQTTLPGLPMEITTQTPKMIAKLDLLD